MHPELLPFFAMKSLGVAVGVFIGAVIGLSVRKKTAGTRGLYRDSVFATSFLASMLAFAVMILIRMATYQG
ncbi:hypothetical protein [Celeribacter indicus]|uniref:Transmembrane protein n=1 Tax=Celeribacter indicus TaxID=1208324 RepID=A0A0B5E3V0_9RHOB|nr:hypothetical protein [Celeribacter indicus]AJE47067.1 hypothetical protein P73_2352 [Celeribacter indicus]SDW91752.1 hypothetical protein SAMN05443573_10984 [Celeribacter indicus]